MYFLCVRGRGEEKSRRRVEKRRVEGEYPVRSAVNVRANMFWLYFCRMS